MKTVTNCSPTPQPQASVRSLNPRHRGDEPAGRDCGHVVRASGGQRRVTRPVENTLQRRIGGEELTALKLPEGPLDFFGYLGAVVVEPLVFGVQDFQSPSDDFIRVLIGTRLHRLGDQFLMLRSQCNGHNASLLAFAPSVKTAATCVKRGFDACVRPQRRRSGPSEGRSVPRSRGVGTENSVRLEMQVFALFVRSLSSPR